MMDLFNAVFVMAQYCRDPKVASAHSTLQRKRNTGITPMILPGTSIWLYAVLCKYTSQLNAILSIFIVTLFIFFYDCEKYSL